MTTPHTYRNANGQTPVKKSRIAKAAASTALPIGRRFSVRGRTATDGYKTFSFAVLSASQQRKERNPAYRFFSID